jgi:hypothetical protein
MVLGTGGFFPLDAKNPSQKNLCDLFPYWNHGNGKPIWTTCQGDQYLFRSRAAAGDCATGDQLDDGCWVPAMAGETRRSSAHPGVATTVERHAYRWS